MIHRRITNKVRGNDIRLLKNDDYIPMAEDIKNVKSKAKELIRGKKKSGDFSL